MMTSSDKACRAIRAAKKESDVIAAVREYMESLGAPEAAKLPAEIAMIGLIPAEEMIQSALQALHAAMGKVREGAQTSVLSEATLVYTTAARRLAVLAQDAV